MFSHKKNSWFVTTKHRILQLPLQLVYCITFLQKTEFPNSFSNSKNSPLAMIFKIVYFFNILVYFSKSFIDFLKKMSKYYSVSAYMKPLKLKMGKNQSILLSDFKIVSIRNHGNIHYPPGRANLSVF